jgi:hypothetical protein
MTTYEAIYDIVATNMTDTGEPWEYGKATFLSEVESEPGQIDIARYVKLANPDFLQAIYVAVYKRLPEPKQISYWAQYYDLPKEHFQSRVLQNIVQSGVAAINHIRFLNNPYFTYRTPVWRTRLLRMLGRMSDMTAIRSLGKKLPKPLQSIVRKIFQ